jgi:hypothetical protein
LVSDIPAGDGKMANLFYSVAYRVRFFQASSKLPKEEDQRSNVFFNLKTLPNLSLGLLDTVIRTTEYIKG